MKCKDCNVWGCQHRTSNAEQECVLHNIAGDIRPSKSAKGFLVPEGSVMTVDWDAFRREAAKECAIREGYLAGLHHEIMKRVFKAGAEWDAGQGYVDTQAVINEYEDWGDGFAKLELGILKNDDFFKDWKKQNEIIVQIRKKQ